VLEAHGGNILNEDGCWLFPPAAPRAAREAVLEAAGWRGRLTARSLADHMQLRVESELADHLAMHGFSPGAGEYCIVCDCVCAPAVGAYWAGLAAGSAPADAAEDAAEAEDEYIDSDLSDHYLGDSDDSLTSDHPSGSAARAGE